MPRFFDVNCMLGRYNLFNSESFYTKERLLQEMAYYGISDALVFHAVSMENSPQLGNQLIMKEVADTPSLHPVWSLLPTISAERGRVRSYLDEMQEHNVRIVRLFPLQFHFDLDDWCFGEVFDMLSEN